jgi:hypothetical protein
LEIIPSQGRSVPHWLRWPSLSLMDIMVWCPWWTSSNKTYSQGESVPPWASLATVSLMIIFGNEGWMRTLLGGSLMSMAWMRWYPRRSPWVSKDTFPNDPPRLK